MCEHMHLTFALFFSIFPELTTAFFIPLCSILLILGRISISTDNVSKYLIPNPLRGYTSCLPAMFSKFAHTLAVNLPVHVLVCRVRLCAEAPKLLTINCEDRVNM